MATNHTQELLDRATRSASEKVRRYEGRIRHSESRLERLFWRLLTRHARYGLVKAKSKAACHRAFRRVLPRHLK